MHTLVGLVQFIFWLIVLIAFFHTLLSHFILWYEMRLSTLANPTTTKMPWVMLTKSFAVEFFLLIASSICYPLAYFNLPFPHKKELATTLSLQMDEAHVFKTPILMVHGYLHNQSAWLMFQQMLSKKTGIGPIFSINLAPPLGSIATLAELLKPKVEEILMKTGAKQVILIGHSMGGLVCSYYTENLAQHQEVAKVITLGTPIQGTRASVFGIGKNAYEMLPNSEFITTLLEKIKVSQVPYYTIASKIDNMVIPWNAALLPENMASQHFVIENYGHMRLLISPHIIEQVSQWLVTS